MMIFLQDQISKSAWRTENGAFRGRKHLTFLRCAAMTEFLLCMFPFAVIFTGVILFGELMLGKQSSAKAFVYASSSPSEEVDSEIESMFFQGQHGTPTISYEAEYEPETEDDDEPVLSYTSDDMEGALTVGSVYAVYDPDTGMFELHATSAGNRLAKLGLIDLSSLTGSTYTQDQISGSLTLNILDEEICQDLADILGVWMDMTRVQVQYAYSLRVKEGQPIDADYHENALASDVTLGESENTAESYAAYGIVVNQDARHEAHEDDGDRISYNDLSSLSMGNGLLQIDTNYQIDASSEWWLQDMGYATEISGE